MSIDTWEPSNPDPEFSIDRAVLREFIQLSRNDQLMQLPNRLSPEVCDQQRPLMRLPRETWTKAAADFNNEELLHLVRFFTVAEQMLDGWEAAEKSPVIWLVRELRRRKAPPDRDLLLWIKANSDNRFLPNGAL